jgi:hypothetical protein
VVCIIGAVFMIFRTDFFSGTVVDKR